MSVDSYDDLLSALARHAAERGSAAAIVDGDVVVTYRELSAAARAVAEGLRAAGLDAGARVGLCARRGADTIRAMLGILGAGSAFVPLDPADSPERLAAVAAGAGVEAVLAPAQWHGAFLGAGLRCAEIGSLEGSSSAAAGLVVPAALAYVIHTSGTTGRPKGVGVPRRALDHFSRAIAEGYGLGPGDRVLQFSSIAFDGSIEEIFPPLFAGATIVIRPEAPVPPPAALLDWCAATELTVLHIPTAYWHELVVALAAGDAELPAAVRIVSVGGEEMRAERLRTWRAIGLDDIRLVNVYGPTETTVVATWDDLAGPLAPPDSEDGPSIGHPVAGVRAHIDDNGELWIGGPGVANGYLGMPGLTCQRFVPGPDGTVYYRTGDRVRSLPQGRLGYLGRMDRQVKVRGFRVEPAEVERALSTQPGVHDAVVHYDQERATLTGYVVPVGNTLDETEIRAGLAGLLPAHAIPSRLVAVSAFPLTSRGAKVDRAALAESFASATGPAGPAGSVAVAVEPLGSVVLATGLAGSAAVTIEPLGAAEGGVRRVAALVEDVLGLAAVDDDESIFALGAHSLTAIRLLARIRREFGVTVDLADLHATPTVGGIAKLIDAGVRRPAVSRPVDADAPLSLTGFQRECWLAEQLQPDTPMYTLGLRYRVSGPVDADEIVAALRQLVDRHDALRSTVREDDAGPVLVVGTMSDMQVDVHDLTGLAPAQQVSRAAELATSRGRTVFDLRNGPLLAATLSRLAADEWELVVAVHHLVFDGWSASVFATDLAALLAKETLPAATPFTDHLRAQGVGEQAREIARKHWIDRLTGIDADVEPPADRPRPPVRSFAGARIERPLDRELFTRIEATATESVTTSAAFVLAAVQTVLARLTGRTDITVLMPTAHRTDPAHDGTVGAFINVLPLRTDLSGGPDFRTALRRAGESLLAALRHQDLSFPELLAALAVPHSANRSPLSQVMLIVVNTPVAAATRGGVTVEHLGDTGNGTAQLDLTLTLDLPHSGPTLTVDYATDLFDAGSADRILDYLLVLLDAAVATPDRAIAELPLLPATLRRELLRHPERATADIGVLDVFETYAESHSGAPALTHAGSTSSYGELDAAANRIAALLHENGVRRGDRVGICVRRGMPAVAAVLACWKRGAAFVPLDPDYPPERLRHMVVDSGVDIVLTGDATVGALGAHARLVPWDSPAGTVVPVLRTPHDAAYLCYTSGSTGAPKGVVVTHGNLAHALSMWRTEFRLQDGWSHLQAAALSFDVFVGDLVRALGTGGRLVICPRETLLDPPALDELMRNEQVDVAELAPAVLRNLIQHTADLSFMRLLIGGADVWYPHEYRRARALVGAGGRVLNSYGVTEATIDSTAFDGAADTAGPGALPIGRPLAGTRIYVLDGHGELAPPGVPGELWIGGPGVAGGYHGRPGLTAERFRPDPFASVPGARMYRTGDAAKRRADGVLEFLGRLDDQVKLHGHRIELAEVEAALSTLPGVEAAAAAVRVDGRGVARLIGYVAPSTTAMDIRGTLGKLLPHYAIPAQTITVPALPLGPSGKVDRAALPQPPEQVAAVAVGPATALEQQLLPLWAEILDRSSVGLDDGLFELGGDSFTALRLVRAMRQRCGIQVALLELYRNPTVRGLAAQLDSAESSTEQSLLHRFTPARGNPVATVIAIPYSGGQAVAFEPLATALPPDWALYALQPPGRDRTRPDEAALPLDALVDRCVAELAELPGPLYLYGHCHGAAITIELARRVEAAGLPLAGVAIGALFPMARLPGRLSDWLHRTLPMDRLVSDRAILEEIRALGGGIGELTDPEERAFVVRAIRHDERGSEDYFARTFDDPSPQRLRAPLLSVVGAKDRVTELYTERYREWEHYAEHVELRVIPKAGHGFLKHQTGQLADILVDWARGDASPTEPEPIRPAPPGPRPSLRRFAAVAISQFASQVGSSLSQLVLSLWAYQQTGRITEFAFVMAIALLPGILLGPVAGAIADRYDRRAVMFCCDLVSGLAVAGMAAAMYIGATGMGQVYALCALTSVAAAFHRPAFLAAIAQLVPKPYLGQANGLSQLGVGAGALFTPMLGAGLLGLVPLQTILLVDAATFAGAAVTLLVVRFPDRLFKRREETVRAQIVNGWRYVLRRPGLVAMLRFFVVDHLLYATGFALITPLVLIDYGVDTLGFVLAAGGIGALSGSLVMGIWGGTARRADGMLLFMGANNFGLVLIGFAGAPWLIAIGMFGMAFTESIINGHWIALVQRKVGLELQGRVLALFITIVTVAMPLGYLVTGPLADRVFRPMLEPGGALADALGPVLGTGPGRGLALVIAVCGLLLTGWTTLAWHNRTLRFVEDVLPDAVPDSEIEDADTEQRRADERLRATTDHGRADQDWIENWRRLYDSAYTGSWDVIGEDFTGWNSSYDDTAIPLAHMREWRAAAVARILALRPRRALEIGVGSGNILAHVAPHCEKYTGTDLSGVAIDYLRTRVETVASLRDRVSLSAGPAHRLETFPDSSFDTIILNSVVQYFPSRAYLDEVLTHALRLLTPGGSLFLGDVRNLRLHRHFLAAIQRHRLPAGTTPDDLSRAVDRAIAAENELLVDPAYFTHLASGTPVAVDIQLKRTTHHNELTAYRYDVVLTKTSTTTSLATAPTLRWGADITTVAELFAESRPEALRVAEIPNRRLTPADLTAPDPEAFRELAEANGYALASTWSTSDPTHIDVILYRPADTPLTDLYLPPAHTTPLVNPSPASDLGAAGVRADLS
ncbi:amino acid adenylation domain-containing protein [Nocardia sp. NPDC052566]|uniref:amino acid adenylation domain-containing protein n=1 Tax=Nocardia sp. NPDC052566 TaxID=3364330 RepID=UPI0037C55721